MQNYTEILKSLTRIPTEQLQTIEKIRVIMNAADIARNFQELGGITDFHGINPANLKPQEKKEEMTVTKNIEPLQPTIEPDSSMQPKT